jgi:hypothetical protein
VASCHNGDLVFYDIRQTNSYEKIVTHEQVHGRKFDEGALALGVHPTMPFFASGGADSLIKIFEVKY